MQFLAITVTTRRNYGGGKHIRPTTMNDMPVPQGDFKTYYAKKQRHHNTILALGVCSLGFGLFLVRQERFLLTKFSK